MKHEKLTVVIATRNDPMLAHTLRSIGEQVPVIIVDDQSDLPVHSDNPNHMVIRNDNRLGPALSRNRGIKLVPRGWVMVTDSHMTFPDNWVDTATYRLKHSKANQVWCSLYKMDKVINSTWHDTATIAGADFFLWRNRSNEYAFADMSPRRQCASDDACIPCVIGACYFFHTDLFYLIGGFDKFMGYGGDEPWLSLSCWMSGGQVQVMHDLPVIHHYQPSLANRRPVMSEWETNKLLILKRILRPEQYDIFCSWLPVHDSVKHMVEMALLERTDWYIHYDGIASLFGLQTFDEAIELMVRYHEDCNRRCLTCHDLRWLVPHDLKPCPQCNANGEIQQRWGPNWLLPQPII